MKNTFNYQYNTELKNNLYFAGTIYDSFEALEETLGKLKLEKPLFLVYLAKKAFAEEVIHASESNEVSSTEKRMRMNFPYQRIILNNNRHQHLQ